MVKIKEKKRVPLLRFSEFSGEWKDQNLGDVFDNVGGTSLEKYVNEMGKYNFISIGNYSKDGKYTDNGQRVAINEKTKTKLLEKNNLTMVLNDKTASGEIIGSTILIDQDDQFIYNQRTERLICKNNLSPHFAWQYLNSKKFRKKVFSIAQGGTQIYVNFPAIKKLDFPLPQKEEQKKIADFLGSVDAWIENLEQQKESWENYKKSMMQKLFPAKDEKVPELRFKDKKGNDFPVWKVQKLEDIVNIKTGRKDVNAGNPSGQYRFYTCAKDYTYSNEYSFEGESIMIAGNAEVGLCQYYDGKFEAYQRTYVLQDFKIKGSYLFRYMSHFFRNYALKLKQTGAMSFIKIGMLNDFIVPIPCNEEQKKIGDFLSAIDDVITAKGEEIAKAREWKKGLMQKMFV